MRYLSTYPIVRRILGYNRRVARHFSKWGIWIPTLLDRGVIGYVEIPEYLPKHGRGQRAIPGTYPRSQINRVANPGSQRLRPVLSILFQIDLGAD
eukprot:scaffold10129_cov69-Cyclotella_meneghiniana.AAC.3